MRIPVRTTAYSVPIPGFNPAVTTPWGGPMLFINAIAGGPTNRFDDVVSETELLVQAIRGALERAGFHPDDVVRARTYIVDLAQYAAVRPVLRSLWGEVFPASTLIQVAALPGGARIQIDIIAMAREHGH